MKIYVATCTWENVAKGDEGQFKQKFISLPEAKAWLKSEYEKSKEEMERGGGYYDDYENEISIADDGMSYSQSGLMESKTIIREQEAKGAAKTPNKKKSH